MLARTVCACVCVRSMCDVTKAFISWRLKYGGLHQDCCVHIVEYTPLLRSWRYERLVSRHPHLPLSPTRRNRGGGATYAPSVNIESFYIYGTTRIKPAYQLGKLISSEAKKFLKCLTIQYLRAVPIDLFIWLMNLLQISFIRNLASVYYTTPTDHYRDVTNMLGARSTPTNTVTSLTSSAWDPRRSYYR